MWKLATVFFMVLVVYSCVFTENYMPETDVYIWVKHKDSLSVTIDHGEVCHINDNLYQVTFDKARGGKTLLFGKTISDHSPRSRNTVRLISKSRQTVMSFDATLKQIDELTRKVRNDIVADSIYLKKNWLIQNSDFEHLSGKRVIAHCLDFYESTTLDSLVRK